MNNAKRKICVFIFFMTILIISACVINEPVVTKDSVDWTKYPRQPQEITWEKAVILLRSGKVILASQSHSKIVELSTNDYKSFITKEPKLDNIMKLIDELDTKRKNINFTTE